MDYVKAVDRLLDAIKQLNQPCGGGEPAPPAEPSEAERRAGAVRVLREMLGALEGGAGTASAAAAAEHSSTHLNGWYVNAPGHWVTRYYRERWLGREVMVPRAKQCTTAGWHDASDCGFTTPGRWPTPYYDRCPHVAGTRPAAGEYDP